MSKMVKTGDVLVRADGDCAIPYEVIIADDKLFVVGAVKSNEDGSLHTDFSAPEIYSNDPSVMTLDEIGFIQKKGE